MAIESVNENHEGRVASITREGKSYERVFKVVTTDRTEKVKKVREAAGIPRIGDRHPEDGTATVSSVKAEPAPGATPLFMVNVRYDDTVPIELEPGEGRAIAESGLPRIGMQTITQREPLEKDAFNNPVLNSAGDRFIPTIEIDRSHLVITIAHRVDFDKFTPDLIKAFIDAVNEKNFFGFNTKQLKITKLGGNMVDITVGDRKDVAWDIQLTMRFRSSWLIELLDLGRFKIDGGKAFTIQTAFSGRGPEIRIEGRRHILDQFGHPVDDPVLLDGEGEPLAKGANAVFLTFNGYNPKDFDELFGKLGLPNTLAGYRALVVT